MAFFSNTKNGITRKNERNKSIAVLPFKNLSTDEENRYFADGIMEDIINQLNKISGLRVTSRTSSEHFRESAQSIPEIAKELGVNYILEGSVRSDENNVKIAVQLIDARNDSHIFSETYERKPENIFDIQSSIAKQVAEKLEMTLTSEEIAKIDKIPTKNPEAHNYYLLGRYFWNQRTEEGVKKSIEYFEKAVEADPQYAVALAGLADGYFILSWWGWYHPQKEGYAIAKKYALEAINLDSELAEAYTVLGGVLTWDDWNWEESRKILKHAIDLNPNFSVAHQYYAELLYILDEKTEARHEIDLAVELDPVAFMHKSVSAAGYFYEEKFVESIRECYKTLEINPRHAAVYWCLFHNYFSLGNDSLAVESIQKRMSVDTSTIKYVPSIYEIYNQSELIGVINWYIEREKNKTNPNELGISIFYCQLNDKENALNWLEKAFKNRSTEIPRINVNPFFDIIRAEPRFLKIIDELGLTKYHKRKPTDKTFAAYRKSVPAG
jgi:TolB-like protein